MPTNNNEKFTVEVLRVIRSRYSDEHAGVVFALLTMAPNADNERTRLTLPAYRKGLLAGLAYDSSDATYPECPYDRKNMGNFASGKNNPGAAWREGSRDALRIRDIVLRPETAIVPALQHREFKLLTDDLKRIHEAKR